MDGPLDHLLSQFSLRAGVFYTGNICGLHEFENDDTRGHLHLVRKGPVEFIDPGRPAVTVNQPTLIFLPRPQAHRLIADDKVGADVVCAAILIGGGGRNPISDSLPHSILIKLSDMPGVEALLEVMFREAFDEHSGRQAALDRLCEVLMIWMLRHCLETGTTVGGALAGLADPKLFKAIEAIHREPAFNWTLISLAEKAGMSRARFAEYFRQVVGSPPADYLTSWRIMLAQRMLGRGVPAKAVASDVGYGDASSLHRAFVRKVGVSPSKWLDQQRISP